MATDEDSRKTSGRGTSERMVLREPHIHIRKKRKPKLRAGKLKLDLSFMKEKPKSIPAPKPVQPPPGAIELERDYGTVPHEMEFMGRTITVPGGPLPMRESGVHSSASMSGYEYEQDRVIGYSPVMSEALAHAAMFELQRDPNRFFPFRVVGHKGETSIKKGHRYDLTNRQGAMLPLPPGRFPIHVTQVTPTSFTFTTLPGHFDPPGSTITFSTWSDSTGGVHLTHRGVTAAGEPSPAYLVAPTVAAKAAWDQQAAALRRWLQQGY